MANALEDRTLQAGQPGYEAARRAAVWNARTPERYPETIVLAHSQEDIQEALRQARQRGLKVGIRSGGHSWAGNHLRNGGMLLDLSALKDLEVDPGSMRASVQPGLTGDELLGALAEHDLFFPAGHCPGVGIGGYLLQGGYGWNGRVHGPACMSVEAIDVVLASGELVHADEHENSELLWAARGGGPGFFGVLSRFYLRLQRRPKLVVNSVFLYSIELLEDVFRWAAEIAPKVAREMEMMVFIHRTEEGELEIALTGPVLVDSELAAREAIAVLESCPVRERAKLALPYVPGELADLYAGAHAAYPDGHRYAADNMWTHAPIEELLPGLHRIAETMPEAPSHMLWMNWGPGSTPAPARPDMAYSVEDDTYIALYGVWREAVNDAAGVAWATERMRELEPLGSGIQLADENLAMRPARFLGEQQMRQMQALRARYDPEQRFHSWMGDPQA
ncbi:MAG TPA: FAD-binding oxidoreductase [Solirubrobacteraceae bacterium]|jgi:FAD/FMN-containing dehydrogenase